jgi:hypothetical protein
MLEFTNLAGRFCKYSIESGPRAIMSLAYHPAARTTPLQMTRASREPAKIVYNKLPIRRFSPLTHLSSFQIKKL